MSGDSALTLSFLNRVSVFETLRVYNGRVFLWEEHWRRLSESCRALGHPLLLNKEAFGRWLNASLREQHLKNAALRASLHWDADGRAEGVLFIRPFISHPKEWYEKGVMLRSTVYRRSSPRAQDPQVKASQYVGGVLAILDAGGERPHELLFAGPGGTIAEGAVSNVFIIREKCLLTPSPASGILKGVTRAHVLRLAAKRGLETEEIPLTRHDLYTAHECFITNTSSEILPAVEIDGRRIGDGKPGKLTRALGKDFRKSR